MRHVENGVTFFIKIVPSAVVELREIDVFWRRRIAQAIDDQLRSKSHEGRQY